LGRSRARRHTSRPEWRVRRQAENEDAIRAIIEEVGGQIPVQLAAAFRDLNTNRALSRRRFVVRLIGTAAVKNPGSCRMRARLSAAISSSVWMRRRQGSTDGWSKLTGHEVADLARKFEDYGAIDHLHDIARGRHASGINIEATVRLARAVKIPVIASGGLSNLADIESLCEVEDEGIEA